jgi:nickel-dependent lactate racemase
MQIQLAYGEGHLTIECPDDRTAVITPNEREGISDERTAIHTALDAPTAGTSLRQLVKTDTRICILFTDITRATPNDRMIPWLLDYLSFVPKENIILLNQLGTHRPNSRAELEKMLTKEVVNNYRVLNAEPENREAHVQFGTTRDGTPALINRHAVEADLRIVTGFIEPHLFAGFSGGPKGIMPGVAALETVMSNHSVENIAAPHATFGITYGNPIWEEMLAIAQRTGPKFLLNVSLNNSRQITNVFSGDLIEAHKTGCDFVKRSAMQAVAEPFDVVVTTNSGHPLDLNLYQGVKGMSAGARILKEGGTLILAAECREGVPSGSELDKLLRYAQNPEEVLTLLSTPGFERPEQWQAQIQALIQRKADVRVYSSLDDDTLRAAHLAPCADISATIAEELEKHGPDARVAVLPQGPLTIPFLEPAA